MFVSENKKTYEQANTHYNHHSYNHSILGGFLSGETHFFMEPSRMYQVRPGKQHSSTNDPEKQRKYPCRLTHEQSPVNPIPGIQ